MRFLTYLKRIDWLLIFLSFSLSLIGLFAIYSSSLFNNDFLNFKKQILFLILGTALMMLFSFIDWRLFRDDTFLVLLAYLINVVLLLGLFVFGQIIRGAHGWYRLGIFAFDPIEPLKIILAILLAKYFSYRHIEFYRLKHIFVSGIYVFLPCLFIFFQPDMGSVIILILFWLIILFVSGIRLGHFLILFLIFCLLFVLGWHSILQDYQRARILAFLFPEYDPKGIGWSQKQAKIALGSGGFLGKGFRKGSQAQLGFLPLPQTDFIFSVIGEEFGFLGISVVLFLILVFLARLFFLSLKTENNFQRLFILGFASLIFLETFIHVGVNLGLLPVIGIPLPFISYGGSNLIFKFIGLGIVQNIKISLKV